MSEGWIIGRVYREGKVVQVKEKDTLQFTVECRRKFGERTFSEYVSVTAYGQGVQQMQIPKGRMIMVSGGRYGARAYVSSKTQEHKALLTYNCSASGINLLDFSENEDAPADRPAPRPAPAPAAQAPRARPAPMPAEDDDVPF